MFTRTRATAVGTIATILLLITTALTVVLPDTAADAAAAALPSGFPNAGNTGLTNPGALEIHSGELRVTQDGAVIQNMEIRGRVEIQARNVVMRNVWVYTSGAWTIYVRPGASLTIEDSEIGHPSHRGYRGIGGNNVTARRIDVHHVEDGIKAGENSLYERIYCHDLDSPSGQPHADCFQDDGGNHNYTLRNSTLDARFPGGKNGNAAIIIKSDLGSIGNVVVDGNYLNGGNYVVYVVNGGHGMPSNVRISNNRFGPDRRHGLFEADGAVSWTNNVWDSNGSPVSPNAAGTRFNDVSSRYVFYNDIEWLAVKGITKSCNPPTSTRFCPSAAVTRGQMAAFLVRALNLPGPKKDWFRDDNGSPFRDDINSLADAGISKGCNPPQNDRFCPDSKVTRGQMAAFLVRARGYTNRGRGNRFIDDNGSVFEHDIDRLGTAGVTKGCNPPTNNRFCPNDPVTRGQMAAFLRRAFSGNAAEVAPTAPAAPQPAVEAPPAPPTGETAAPATSTTTTTTVPPPDAIPEQPDPADTGCNTTPPDAHVIPAAVGASCSLLHVLLTNADVAGLDDLTGGSFTAAVAPGGSSDAEILDLARRTLDLTPRRDEDGYRWPGWATVAAWDALSADEQAEALAYLAVPAAEDDTQAWWSSAVAELPLSIVISETGAVTIVGSREP